MRTLETKDLQGIRKLIVQSIGRVILLFNSLTRSFFSALVFVRYREGEQDRTEARFERLDARIRASLTSCRPLPSWFGHYQRMGPRATYLV